MSNGAPVLSQVQWIGTTTIQANFTSSSGSTFMIGLFQGSNELPNQSAPSTPGVAMLYNPVVDTTSVWTIRIAATSNGIVTGQWSNAIPVIVGPPQNINVANDGVALTLSWTPPAGVTVADGASIMLLDAQGTILDNTTVLGTSTVYRPPGGINPAISYTVKVGGTLNTSFGPYSPAIAVIQGAPQFSQITYGLLENGGASVTANASSASSFLVLSIFAQGTLVASAVSTTAGSFVQISLPQALDPAFQYDAFLAYTVSGGATRGPLSTPQNLITLPVTIGSVSYDGTNVTVSWDNGVGTPAPTGGYVQILNSAGGTVAWATPYGNSVTWAPSPALAANTPYTLKINPTRSVSTGPVSSSVDVLTFTETLSSVSYDGNNITASWTRAGSPDVERTIVALLNGGAVVQTQPGGSTSTTIAAALAPGGTYDLALQTAGEDTLGPLGPSLPVISAVPRVTGAVYAITGGSTSSIAVTWDVTQTSGAHGVGGYIIQLYENGAKLGSALTIDGSGSIGGTIHVNSVLDVSKTHAVTVQAFGTNTTGALSAASPVITAAPVLTSLEYDAGTVTASWLPVAQDGVSGYKVTVGATTVTTSAASISFAYAASGASPTFSVAALGASATGPAASETMLTEAVTITFAGYDGAVLNLSWETPSPSPDYLIQVLQDGSVIASQRGGPAGQAAIGIVLGTYTAYSAVVRAAGPNVLGPSGTPAIVIAAMPAVGPVTVGATIDVTLTAPVNTAGITNYYAALFIGNEQIGPWMPATHRVASILLPSPLVPSGYAVRGKAMGNSLMGPPTPPVPVILQAPEIASLVFDGASAAMAWTAVEGATGYEVIASASPASPHYAGGTSLTFPILSAADTLTVSAITGVATGPASAPLAVIVEEIAPSSVSYDGAFLSVSWSAASTPGATYVVELVNNGTVEIAFDATGTSGHFPASLSPSGNYAVQIRVASGASVGAPGTAVTAISAIPTIGPIVTGDSIAVTLTAPQSANGITGYQAALFIGDELLGSWVNASGMTATLPLPSPLVPSGYSVRARATGTNLTGPMTSAAPVVVAAPEILSIDFDGANASVAWTPVEGASGYEIVASASPATPHYTSGTSLTFPILSTADTLTVSAISGVATGPASGAVAVIVETVAPTQASYDGSFLTLTWPAAQTNGATYVVELLNNGAVDTAFDASGTSGQFPAALSPSGTYTARIRVISGVSAGAPGTALAAISASPAIAAIVASATALTVTLTAPQPASGIAGYEAALFSGPELIGAWTPASGTTVTLPIASPANPWQYTVQARATAASATGPAVSAEAITVAPENLEATYDGENVLAAWDAVTVPSVVGYRVTLASGATVLTSPDTASTSISIPWPLALATNDYGVTVQAIGDVATGPPSESANPVADSVGYFFPPGLVSPSAPADYAYVFRGDIRQPGPSSEITLFLPDIFKAPLAAPIHAAPFTIETAPAGSGLPYQLVVGGGSPPDIWTFTTNGIRPDVAAAAASVFSQAAPLTAPGGLAVLQQVFAQGLPLNFAETLFYAYGLNGQAGYVNLQPGMRLRIDYENYQLVSNSPTDKLNGYSGSGTSTYDIVSLPTNGAYLPVAFDAFLSQLSVPSVTANTGGDGGIIDLQGSAYALQFFRLFYPPRFPSADSAGVIGASQNAVILGASTYAALQAATTQYLSFNNFNGITGIVWTYFRGRATLIPELEVFVNGVPVWVSLGTTAGQLLQRTSALPYAENTSATRFLYRRSVGNVVDAASEVLPSYAIGRSNVVNFSYGTVGQYTGGLDPFDLPVLSGDSLTFES